MNQTGPKSMYIDVINSSVIPSSKHVWKVKVPLKIKVFMWFVHKQVILTKNNLAKRNWTGSTRCSFCDQHESIKHLFLDCPLAKLLWYLVHIAFNFTPSNSIPTLFGTWINEVETNIARRIQVGVCALFWAMWNTRNDLIFNDKNASPLQVIFHYTHSSRTWSTLQRAEYQPLLKTMCM